MASNRKLIDQKKPIRKKKKKLRAKKREIIKKNVLCDERYVATLMWIYSTKFVCIRRKSNCC